MTTKTKKSKKGFTLVELIAVMAIIGILALLIVPQFANVTDGANARIFENNARTLVSQASLYTANNNGATPKAANMGTLEEGLPADYKTRISAATGAQTYIINDTDNQIQCTLVLTSGRQYAFVYDFATGKQCSAATINGAKAGIASTTNTPTDKWGDKTK